MCMAIPMKLVEKSDAMGIVELEGLKLEVSLQLLDEVNVGEYLIVHAGFAIQKLDEDEALETIELIREIQSIGIDQETQRGHTERNSFL